MDTVPSWHCQITHDRTIRQVDYSSKTHFDIEHSRHAYERLQGMRDTEIMRLRLQQQELAHRMQHTGACARDERMCCIHHAFFLTLAGCHSNAARAMKHVLNPRSRNTALSAVAYTCWRSGLSWAANSTVLLVADVLSCSHPKVRNGAAPVIAKPKMQSHLHMRQRLHA